MNVKPSKKSNLIDFTSCLLEIMQKVVTLTNIKEGFLANGVINECINMCLEWSKIIRTIKKKSDQF